MTEKCKSIEPYIISAAFNDGKLHEILKTYFHIRYCKHCSALFKEYKDAAKAIHNLPVLNCPDELIHKTEKIIGKSGINTPSFILDVAAIFTRVRFRTIAASVVLVVCITIGLFLLRDRKEVKPLQYSNEEINKANYQAQQALAFVGKILNGTQAKLKDEVIPKHIAKPLEKSITAINNLFESGGKNESN